MILIHARAWFFYLSNPISGKAMQAGGARVGGDLLVFLRADAPVYRTEFFVVYLASGMVLRHDIDAGVGREFAGEELQDGAGVGQVGGHDQVTYQQAAPGQSVGVRFQHANLTLHFFERLAGDHRVISGEQVFQGDFRVPDFEIGHVNVNDLIQQAKGRKRVVGGCVVDQRQVQPRFDSQRQGFENLWDDMRGGHEVDVVTSHRL